MSALARDLLFDHREYSQEDQAEVFQAIEREYAYQDTAFNPYEEEFIAGKYLKLVDSKLWEYWEYCLREHLSTHVKQNHWRLRRQMRRTFPPFVDLVERNYIMKRAILSDKE